MVRKRLRDRCINELNGFQRIVMNLKIVQKISNRLYLRELVRNPEKLTKHRKSLDKFCKGKQGNLPPPTL